MKKLTPCFSEDHVYLTAEGNDRHLFDQISGTRKKMLLCSTKVVGILSVLIVSSLFWAASAAAQAEIDQCNDVLKGDLFNKVTSSNQSAESAKRASTEYIFSLDASKAFSEYETA